MNETQSAATQITPDTAAPGAKNRWLTILTAVMLIGQFAARVLVPAHEYPMRQEQVLTMGLDALMLAALIGLRRNIPAALFWPAAVAGVGLFLIRFTSDAAWWTGHLVYSLQLR